MKKYSKIAYISVVIIALLFGFFIYKVSGKNSAKEDIKSKSLSEVKFLEDKFSNLFNEINNINFENYKISVKNIKEENKSEESGSKESGSADNSGSSGGSNQSGSSGGSSGSGGSEGSSNSSEGSSNSQGQSDSSNQNKEYNLEETGILTNNSEINWNQIKNNVEDMYTFIYTTTLDLYQVSDNQQDIVNFNKEYDNLTKAVKEENKEDTLKELSIIYDYLPRFMENCTDEEKEKIILNTKNNIFKAYSMLEQEDWQKISENVNNAIQEFTKLITNVEHQQNINQYSVNKAYIIINELQNAVALEDKEVFLIKYKNLLEELQRI